MSKIQQIIEREEYHCDKGNAPTEYQQHLHILSALDCLADELERIATALEVRNMHDGIGEG